MQRAPYKDWSYTYASSISKDHRYRFVMVYENEVQKFYFEQQTQWFRFSKDWAQLKRFVAYEYHLHHPTPLPNLKKWKVTIDAISDKLENGSSKKDAVIDYLDDKHKGKIV